MNSTTLRADHGNTCAQIVPRVETKWYLYRLLDHPSIRVHSRTVSGEAQTCAYNKKKVELCAYVFMRVKMGRGVGGLWRCTVSVSLPIPSVCIWHVLIVMSCDTAGLGGDAFRWIFVYKVGGSITSRVVGGPEPRGARSMIVNVGGGGRHWVVYLVRGASRHLWGRYHPLFARCSQDRKKEK
jgi:hypothetical protein